MAMLLGVLAGCTSSSNPCADAGSYAETQACQSLERIKEECKEFKGTSLYAECIADKITLN